MADRGAVWREGKVVQASKHLTERKLLVAAPHEAAPEAASPVRKVKETSPRLLAVALSPPTEPLRKRHVLTKDKQAEANEHLYYLPVKSIAEKLKQLDKKYLSSLVKNTERVDPEAVGQRMHNAYLETKKKNHETLMNKYVSDPGVKILTPEDGTVLIKRIYNTALEKKMETFDKLVEKYVPKREYPKLNKDQLMAATSRLTTKK